jgi:hypothetical protein
MEFVGDTSRLLKGIADRTYHAIWGIACSFREKNWERFAMEPLPSVATPSRVVPACESVDCAWAVTVQYSF